NAIEHLGEVDLGQRALTLVDAVDLTITGTVAAGSVTIAAPALTLAGGAITTVGVQVYHGAMTLGAATTLASQYGGITLDGALDLGAFDLHEQTAGVSLFADAISGSGRLFLEGGGTTMLRAINSYTGETLVAAGTLLVDGSITGLTTVAGGGTL